MKKLIAVFILVIYLFTGTVVAQNTPPPPINTCECCFDEWQGSWDPNFTNCFQTYCEPEGIDDPADFPDCSVIPIDQNITLLLLAGIAIGTYTIYNQRKKATN